MKKTMKKFYSGPHFAARAITNTHGLFCSNYEGFHRHNAFPDP